MANRFPRIFANGRITTHAAHDKPEVTDRFEEIGYVILFNVVRAGGTLFSFAIDECVEFGNFIFQEKSSKTPVGLG